MSLTLKEMIAIGENQLINAGVMNPKVDAEILYMDMRGIDKTRLFMEWGNEIDDDTCEQYFQLVDRRGKREPLQYITGTQEFMGLEFAVDENVLIPRPETEFMVEHALKIILGRASGDDNTATGEAASNGTMSEAELLTKILPRKKWNVLDLCCGSGAIGVTIAHRCMNAKVTATDNSAAAIEVAKRNAEKARAKVRFKTGDLLGAVKAKHQFDMIISNPPYVPTHMIPILQEEVKNYEPIEALDGGEDGFDFYRRIIKDAPGYLKMDGVLILETGHDQGNAIADLINADNAYFGCAVLKDYNKHDRVCIALMK